MKLGRIRREVGHGPRDFSRWIHPKMKGYILVCCDCGLAHEMEFSVMFRARRAAKYTARERAKMKKNS